MHPYYSISKRFYGGFLYCLLFEVDGSCLKQKAKEWLAVLFFCHQPPTNQKCLKFRLLLFSRLNKWKFSCSNNFKKKKFSCEQEVLGTPNVAKVN